MGAKEYLLGPGFNVLKTIHLMIGYDLHDLMPPGSPSITGKTPNFCVMILRGTGLTATWAETTDTHWGKTMQRNTDIGPLIPHFGAPNVLMPLIWLFSGSKSYFGTTQVLVEKKPAAVAVAKLINLNLNCSGPTKCPPLPSDVVLAYTTHQAAFTVGDFVAGLAQMTFDSLLQWGLANFFSLPFFGKITTPIYEKLLFGPIFNRLVPALGNNAFMNYLYGKGLVEFLAKGVAIQLPLHIAGLLLGSPVGYSPPFAPIGSGGYGSGSDPEGRSREEQAHDAIRDWVNGVPNQHPSGPPPSTGAAAPGPDAGVP
jgi:hypothetical protein